MEWRGGGGLFIAGEVVGGPLARTLVLELSETGGVCLADRLCGSEV